jgi:DNA-binding XRE family transcriptional regulator
MRPDPPPPTPLIRALLAERPELDPPAAIWQLVQRVLASGWEPLDRAEAAQLLVEAERLIGDSLTDGQPPDWQWNLGADLGMLHRIANGETISLLEILSTIRLNVVAHRWHIDYCGSDRLADIRWRFVGCLGRLAMDTEPRDWERQLIGRPLGEPLYARPAERTRRRREAAGLTQGELAARVGVSRSTVVRWEAGTRRPTSSNAEALVGALGGQQADYVSP